MRRSHPGEIPMTPLPLVNVRSLCRRSITSLQAVSGVCQTRSIRRRSSTFLSLCEDLIRALDDSIDLQKRNVRRDINLRTPAASGPRFRRFRSMFQHMIRVFRNINHSRESREMAILTQLTSVLRISSLCYKGENIYDMSQMSKLYYFEVTRL